MQKVESFMQRFGKMFIMVMMCALFVALSCFSVFASPADSAVVKTEDLEPILTSAADNVAAVMPIGVGLLTITIGIGFLIFIIMKFVRR